jgi:glycogen operon protein
MEWNGHYRDVARKFLRGDAGIAGDMVQGILGSPNLYASSGRKPTASVNFITCHDGFTLRDLYTYNSKRNLENGEGSMDGSNDNSSWNCGVEGETDDPSPNDLRFRLQRNAMALLFLSQGVPMLSMGDELGRTQLGNNNAYCHDEPWNWLDWTPEQSEDAPRGALRNFVSKIAAFRRLHPQLRRAEFFTGAMEPRHGGFPDISWHGVKPWKPDWGAESRSLAFLIAGDLESGGPEGDFIYAAFNMWHEPLLFELPRLPAGMRWRRVADTGRTAPGDFLEDGAEELLKDQSSIPLKERSVAILIGNREGRLG